ncbi:MAG: tetratricopeptide repeat protein [Saprospiraceae bacterium]|nr:tetratricopeptide repeat protein [Saprospiraceae bacterium]MCF8250987.1 tetratricopeptide repeat protein [Saprospiraceae bacterium]MCF8280316.1 tetratricopeptide repeat protein [Bacteroidales bacterium]MCF8312843.1 tetratricopeptide repeat protein [Saprospiraceae bacterium]MCF8441290.1 tetratricopeptide repeat protein [Saprospiraceae bacterium]
MITRLLSAFFVLALLAGCTPKTPKATTETPTKPVKDPNKPCKTFDDAPYPDKALEEFVLYKDFLKANDWDGAWTKWQYVYKNSPNADGNRSTVYTDGIKFYEHFMEKDSTKKEEYITEIFKIYDAMEKCMGDGGHVTGLKAFDYFFKYPTRISKEELYKLFKKSIEMDGGKPRYFILNPLTSVLVDLAQEEKVPLAEAQKYNKIIRDAIETGLAECKGKDCENWQIIAEYAPARLEALESIEGFYPCTYYSDKYYPQFQANPTDCETIINTYSRMKWGKCDDNDPKLQAVNAAYQTNCKKPDDDAPTCNELLRSGKYRDAVKCLEEAIPGISSNSDKAKYNYLIAQIYFAYLKNFPKARQYAREASRLRPGWGDPYILVGLLYASSGPLCGPGRGWDSQVVVWPAIDEWQKAKSIDPSVSGKANGYINQYSQYMPSREELFQRLKKEGDSFFVPCWIQESTTIRAKP